jgi:N-acyl-D-amino-acid deacylase
MVPPRRRALALLAFTCAVPLLAQPRDEGPARYDVLLRDGLVVDGTGAAPFRADIGVLGGHIAAVGDLARATGRTEFDLAGLTVAPGFVNIHSHADPAALPTAENMLTQGVTTEVLNPDGAGPLDIATQLDGLEAAGLALNVGAYVGFNSAWLEVVGPAERRPSPADIARLQQVLVTNLDAGAWGVSSGLDYKPAYFASTSEVIAVLKAAAPYRTNFANHDRLTPETQFSSRAGVAETVAIGREAGVVPVATHMKVQGREQGQHRETLQLLGTSRAPGQYATADVYPYLAGQSGLGALIIPAWAQDGGRAVMLTRFTDPTQRARIVAEAEAAMAARFGGPGGVYLPARQRELTDVMREWGVGAGEAVVRLLEQEDMPAILRFGAEADLVALLQHPSTSVACDCGATTATRTHPRNYGTFPRVLGRYVREQRVLGLADAVRKMTLLPAATIGLADRGAIAPGMAADLTVFDAATVIDHATYEQPARLSEGIRHVLVNGRPMPAGLRTIAARGGLRGEQGVWEFVLEARQPPAGRPAGRIRLLDAAGRAVVDVTGVGFVQTAPGWAGIVGHDGTAPVTVLVDERDPAGGAGPVVTIVRPGHAVLRGVLSGSVAIGLGTP